MSTLLEKIKILPGSDSIYDINVPEVSFASIPTCEFTYNYYVENERLPNGIQNSTVGKNSLDKLPRYVRLSWESPVTSETQKLILNSKARQTRGIGISKKSDDIVSEDDSPSYFVNTFSDVSFLSQGSIDLENYNYLSSFDTESLNKMASNVIKEFTGNYISSENSDRLSQVQDIASGYRELSNYPKESLGLSIYDRLGISGIADSNRLSTIATDVSLPVKINSLVLSDVCRNSRLKTNPQFLQSINSAENAAKSSKRPGDIDINPVRRLVNIDSVNAASIIGYKIDRYVCRSNGDKILEGTFFCEDPTQTSIVDTGIAYGNTYIYAITTIASIVIYPVEVVDGKPTSCTPNEIYVSSKPTFVSVECHEYRPPPPPEDISCYYDYLAGNLIISWDMPTNPQKDIVQFQLFRRKSIKDSFELIAQYHFDNTIPGGESNTRFTTGEYVDPNNPYLDQTWVNLLVKKTGYPVYQHIDRDFVVDNEYMQPQSYIYALCSIDAHGMISNYSSQYLVEFDPMRNRLSKTLICDSGSPRQYPNFYLRSDAFKDSIRVSGVDSKKLRIALTPEYFNVFEKSGKSTTGNVKNILKAKKQGAKDDPHYLFQIINLDNQQQQTIKISVRDPNGLTISPKDRIKKSPDKR